MLVAQSCPILCNHIGSSLPGSSVHGILQTKILEWVAITFSRRDLPDPGIKPDSSELQEILFRLSHQGSPIFSNINANSRGVTLKPPEAAMNLIM